MNLTVTRKKNTAPDTSQLSIRGEMCVYTVSRLKKILINEFREAENIILKLDEVQRIDTAGFQLLIFFHDECKRNGKEFLISEKNETVDSILRLYKTEL